MSTPQEWAIGYARQAQADYKTYDWLQKSEDAVPECHRLLFLQMCCEKLTKAHLCSAETSPADLQSSHAYTA